MFAPCGEFTPDQPDYNNPGSDLIQNVYPRTQQSYGPVAAFSPFATALPGICIGASTGIDSGGNNYVFAGDTTDLFLLQSGQTAFGNVSKTAAVYAAGIDEQWNFTQFGQNILATDFNDAIQVYTLGSSTKFADLSATAPKARYICTVKDFVMVGNTYDATNGAQPQRVWWSGINNSASWPTPGTTAAAQVQSDYQDIPGDQGWMQGIVGNLGNADVAVFFERAIWRGIYVGSPAIFAFQPAEGIRGTPAPGSIVQVGSNAFYLGEDGFYMFDGSYSQPIGASKVDKWFYSNLNQNYIYKITSAVDPINKIVFWAFPSSASTNGTCDILLMYNWALNRWSYANISIERIFRALTFGYTLEGLDVINASLDALPYSLDSRIWTGGSIILAGFDGNNAFGYFSGSNLAPTVETSEIEPAKMTRNRVFVRTVRPIVDGGAPSVSVGYRNTMQQAVTYSSASAVNSVGECPTRADGRFVRARITLPAASSFDHISGADFAFTETGGR